MSGRIHRSRIPRRSLKSLPSDQKIHIIEWRNWIGNQMVATEFENEPDAPYKRVSPDKAAKTAFVKFENERGGPLDGPPLPQLIKGYQYVEFDVGKARANAAGKEARGKIRVVFMIHKKTRHVAETYYTDEHYTKGSFEMLT